MWVFVDDDDDCDNEMILKMEKWKRIIWPLQTDINILAAENGKTKK